MSTMLMQTHRASCPGSPSRSVLIGVVDDWFRGRGGSIAAAPQPAPDPPLMSALYLRAAAVRRPPAIIRLLVAERLDFSAVLLGITVVTGIVWGLDVAVLPQAARRGAATAAGKDFETIPEPGTVDYARSFFPVALVVLLLRSFIFEPFRIPSDSMMPTLLDGDFIIVNKYAYGLRLPVLDRKFVAIGEPQRGDVVVFRYPLDPSRELHQAPGGPAGRPCGGDATTGSRSTASRCRSIVAQPYNDGCYVNFQLAPGAAGRPRPPGDAVPGGPGFRPDPLAGLQPKGRRAAICAVDDQRSRVCSAKARSSSRTCPAGMYFMMGDNRDNSEDGRFWGFVPEDNLVGKATRIWFNWDWGRSGGPKWSRIGMAIQ